MIPTISVAEFHAVIRGERVEHIDLATRDALVGAQQTVEGFLGYPLSEYDGQPIPGDIRAALVRLAHSRLNPMTGQSLESIRARAESELRPYRKEPARHGVAA